MPGPYRRIDEPNVNQFVVTQPPPKAKKKAAAEPAATVEAKDEAKPEPVKATAKKSTA